MAHQNEKTWIYVFVRTDLPIEQIVVQSNHAAYESGLAFENTSTESTSVICISCKNKHKLQKAYDELQGLGVEFVQFHEPDWDYGFTAFASAPVTAEQRSIFRKYQLFKGDAK